MDFKQEDLVSDNFLHMLTLKQLGHCIKCNKSN